MKPGRIRRSCVRFFAPAGRTDVDEADPEDEGTPTPARHLEDRAGGGAVRQVCELWQFLCALLGADRGQHLLSLDPVQQALHRRHGSRGVQRHGQQGVPRMRAVVCGGRAVALLLCLPRHHDRDQRRANRATATSSARSRANYPSAHTTRFKRTITDEQDELRKPACLGHGGGARGLKRAAGVHLTPSRG